MRGEAGTRIVASRTPGFLPPKGEFSAEADSAILRPPRRSGRVAEGGALLRRYGGINLHRGFESLLLRLASPRLVAATAQPATATGRVSRACSGHSVTCRGDGAAGDRDGEGATSLLEPLGH